MKAKLIFALVLLAALSLLTMTAATAAVPSTWVVNAAFSNNGGCTTSGLHCQTISAAVNAASSGDTILVAAGTYNESVTIGKALRLNGAQAEFDARTRSGSESVVTSMSIQNASNVIIDGFSFSGTSSQVTVEPNSTIASGIVIENNIFAGYGSVGMPTTNAGNILVQRNLFKNAGASAEPMQFKSTLSGGCNGIQVLNNAFSAATTNEGADVNFSCTGSNSSNLTILGNASTGNSGGASFAAISGIVDGISITNNAATTSGSALFFWGSISGSVVIANNNITNSDGSAVSIHGGDLGNGSANTGTFTITGNSLTGNVRGVYVASTGLGAGVVAKYNVISGNSAYGVDNAASGAVDASSNWWGSSSGPGAGNNGVNGNVTTSPYAVALTTSTTASTHELGETASLMTNVSATGIYGAQLVVDHASSVLGFSTGLAVNVPSATPPWSWDYVVRNFVATSGRTELSGSMRRDSHPAGANLTGNVIAQWNYSCNGTGTSSLSYDTTANTGTILADINGTQIPAALIGDSITCVPVTASSTSGVIGLQGRTQGATTPAGWNGAVVMLTCTSGACMGSGPYVLPTTDVSGNYAVIKAGAGTGVATGTYTALVSRRAYLDASKTAVVISIGSNVLSTPTLLGGNVVQDNSIDIGDLSAIGGAFGNPVTADTGSDVNGDGVVNILDLVLAGGNYGLSSPQTWP